MTNRGTATPAAGPAPAATDLARAMLDTGWTLTGAAVRVIHTASLSDACGLTVAVSSEAGRVRLGLDAAPASAPGAFRAAWQAVVTGTLPVAVLAAVADANRTATNSDQAGVGGLLTAAGWRHVGGDHWASPTVEADVHRIDEDLSDDGPLRWQIRRPDIPAWISADDDTPPAVIAALALAPVPTASAVTGAA